AGLCRLRAGSAPVRARRLLGRRVALELARLGADRRLGAARAAFALPSGALAFGAERAAAAGLSALARGHQRARRRMGGGARADRGGAEPEARARAGERRPEPGERAALE